MTRMPHLALLEWDSADQLRVTARGRPARRPGRARVRLRRGGRAGAEGDRAGPAAGAPGSGGTSAASRSTGVRRRRRVVLERETLHLWTTRGGSRWSSRRTRGRTARRRASSGSSSGPSRLGASSSTIRPRSSPRGVLPLREHRLPGGRGRASRPSATGSREGARRGERARLSRRALLRAVARPLDEL